MWALENGWAVIAPEFRGVNDDVESVGSDLAVQDVVDAIDFATSQEGVDAERVFTVGYSGGGMMSLLIAGRHPEKVTGVAAWGPPYDLIAFYEQSLRAGRHYASDIRAGCGGDPREAGPVQDECLRRSAMSHLDAAKDNGVAVYIAQGLSDPLVSPGQGVRAFNQLADPADRLTDAELDAIARGALPEAISGELSTDSFFGEDDPAPLFARKSGSACLVLFRADHEMVYGATLRWLAENAG
jgi:dipeptidyl aminopeptidase/acylaminoacyl peptidase